MQGNMTFIQKFQLFIEKVFWIHGHKQQLTIAFHFTLNLHLHATTHTFMRQHFEETVKPGKKSL